MSDDAVVSEVDVRAPAADVFAMFTDPAKLVRWIGIRALLEPRPGGAFRFEVVPGEFCSGRYVELVPGRRVVFTWGWESGALPVSPGSTTVEVDLEERDGVTHVRLTHRGLDAAMRPWHADGWRRYLARLAAAAEGRDAGPDPAAAHAQTGPPATLPEP
ncbi:MAG: hypothetical protein QOI64_1119 [Solirubrobacteraceae bacterium]|nr:hypothetical protein [Solirubrobacteraceae bacterium]